MRTFDQSLLELVTLGDVEVEEAIEAASVPHDFQLMLQQAQPAKPALSFERDIKPLFGSSDRTSMKWAFDVWDYDDTVGHAQEIVSMLEERSFPDRRCLAGRAGRSLPLVGQKPRTVGHGLVLPGRIEREPLAAQNKFLTRCPPRSSMRRGVRCAGCQQP